MYICVFGVHTGAMSLGARRGCQPQQLELEAVVSLRCRCWKLNPGRLQELLATQPPLAHLLPTSRPPLAHLTHTPRIHLSPTSRPPLAHLAHTSHTPRTHLSHTSHTPFTHLAHTSHTSHTPFTHLAHTSQLPLFLLIFFLSPSLLLPALFNLFSLFVLVFLRQCFTV